MRRKLKQEEGAEERRSGGAEERRREGRGGGPGNALARLAQLGARDTKTAPIGRSDVFCSDSRTLLSMFTMCAHTLNVVSQSHPLGATLPRWAQANCLFFPRLRLHDISPLLRPQTGQDNSCRCRCLLFASSLEVNSYKRRGGSSKSFEDEEAGMINFTMDG